MSGGSRVKTLNRAPPTWKQAKSMHYKILIAPTVIGLAEFVNRQIAKDYRPIGGIAVCDTAPDGVSYYQAMETDETPEADEADEAPAAK